jgi:large subunit ribosomal protein L20
MHTKRRRNLLSLTKGFRFGRKNRVKAAKEAVLKAGQNAYRDRRKKKRDFRRLWNVRINAAARTHDTTYSRLIHDLKERNIELDRKVLAELAADHPDVFSKIATSN